MKMKKMMDAPKPAMKPEPKFKTEAHEYDQKRPKKQVMSRYKG